MFNGIWGMLRKLGVVVVSQEGGLFATSIWVGWFLQLVLQIVVQPSYLADIGATRAPPELAAFAFGMNFMPAYLDSKGQELPDIIEPDYYGEEEASSSPSSSGGDNNKKKNGDYHDDDDVEEQAK